MLFNVDYRRLFGSARYFAAHNAASAAGTTPTLSPTSTLMDSCNFPSMYCSLLEAQRLLGSKIRVLQPACPPYEGPPKEELSDFDSQLLHFSPDMYYITVQSTAVAVL